MRFVLRIIIGIEIMLALLLGTLGDGASKLADAWQASAAQRLKQLEGQ